MFADLHDNIPSLTEKLVAKEGTDAGRSGVARSESEEAPLLDHHEVWLPGSTIDSSNTNESFRCRQKKLYERTRTVQAALPDLFLEIVDQLDQRVETDDVGAKPEKIVSHEAASKRIGRGQTSTKMVSEIISQWQEKSANGRRVESDGGIDEKSRMIPLQKWKEIREGK